MHSSVTIFLLQCDIKITKCPEGVSKASSIYTCNFFLEAAEAVGVDIPFPVPGPGNAGVIVKDESKSGEPVTGSPVLEVMDIDLTGLVAVAAAAGV